MYTAHVCCLHGINDLCFTLRLLCTERTAYNQCSSMQSVCRIASSAQRSSFLLVRRHGGSDTNTARVCLFIQPPDEAVAKRTSGLVPVCVYPRWTSVHLPLLSRGYQASSCGVSVAIFSALLAGPSSVPDCIGLRFPAVDTFWLSCARIRSFPIFYLHMYMCSSMELLS
ncbi:hypothetical protein FKM82_017212 [Ascaphus truei]